MFINKRLLEMLRDATSSGRVTLSSGKISDFYIDARQVTLTQLGSVLTGQAIWWCASGLDLNTIAGPTIAACPMVTGAGIVSAQFGFPMKLAYIRSKSKEHGLSKTVEGPLLTPDDQVLLVDDVLTTGSSLVKAAFALAELGVGVEHAFVLVDRQEGGQEILKEAGITLHALTTRNDLVSD